MHLVFCQVLFREAMASPETNLHRLNLLDPASSSLVLDTFNSTQEDFPESSSCLHDLFEAQADIHPAAACIKCEGMPTLSYGAVDIRANELAHLLIEMGINKEDTVAIMFQRCADLVSHMTLRLQFPVLALCSPYHEALYLLQLTLPNPWPDERPAQAWHSCLNCMAHEQASMTLSSWS